MSLNLHTCGFFNFANERYNKKPNMLGKRTRLQSIVPNPTTCFISDRTTHTLTLTDQPPTQATTLKMSHVVFYTVLGDGQHSLSPKTPANTCGFALNRSGTFTCKRLGSLPKKPSLLVIAEQGRTFVLEIDQALSEEETISSLCNQVVLWCEVRKVLGSFYSWLTTRLAQNQRSNPYHYVRVLGLYWVPGRGRVRRTPTAFETLISLYL